MTDMIERVARAIGDAYETAGQRGHLRTMRPSQLVLDVVARAAIEAMRGDAVPVFEDISNMDREWKQSRLTADMLNAGECAAWCNGDRPFGYNGVLNIWRAMIDAALNPAGERK